MKNIGAKQGRWLAVRKQLNGWEKSAILSLVQDLYDSDPETRDFIHARCQDQDGEGSFEALETYRSKIVEQFFPEHGFGKLKLGEARKAIRDYYRATANLAGKVELLMSYVENCVKFTCQYGDIDERFYDSAESVLQELFLLLRGKARELYPQYQDRLARIEAMTDGMGWGFHDFIQDVVGQLEDELFSSGPSRSIEK